LWGTIEEKNTLYICTIGNGPGLDLDLDLDLDLEKVQAVHGAEHVVQGEEVQLLHGHVEEVGGEADQGGGEPVDGGEGGEPAGGHGGLAGEADPGGVQLGEEVVVGAEEGEGQVALPPHLGGQHRHPPHLHHLGEEVRSAADTALEHRPVPGLLLEGQQGGAGGLVPPPLCHRDILGTWGVQKYRNTEIQKYRNTW